jgi:hypothetical protein
MAKLGKKYLSKDGLGELVGKIKTRYVRTESDNTTFSNVDLTGYTLSEDITDKSPVMIGVSPTESVTGNIVKQSSVTIGGEKLSYKTTTAEDGTEVTEYSKDILVTEKAVFDLFKKANDEILAEGAVMTFLGVTTTNVSKGTDKSSANVTIGGNTVTATVGDVVVYYRETDEQYKKTDKPTEYIWNGIEWHEIGQVFNSEAITSILSLADSTNKKYAITANEVYEDGKIVEGAIQLKLVITETNADKNWDDYKADTKYGHIHLSQGTDKGLKAEYGREVIVVADTITGGEIDAMFN